MLVGLVILALVGWFVSGVWIDFGLRFCFVFGSFIGVECT